MKTFLSSIFLLVGLHGFSQQSRLEKFRDSLYEVAQKSQIKTLFQDYTDSLHHIARTATNDSIRTWAIVELSNNYKYRKPDSSVFFAKKAISMAREFNLRGAELTAMTYYMLTVSAIGNDAKALQLALQKIKLSEQLSYGE